jgi:hypothetical protein
MTVSSAVCVSLAVWMANLNIQLDHALELQLSKAALIEAGFCNAWESILGVANKKFMALDKTTVFQPLKNAANLNSGLFYVDEKFNGEVRFAHSSTSFLKFN